MSNSRSLATADDVTPHVRQYVVLDIETMPLVGLGPNQDIREIGAHRVEVLADGRHSVHPGAFHRLVRSEFFGTAPDTGSLPCTAVDTVSNNLSAGLVACRTLSWTWRSTASEVPWSLTTGGFTILPCSMKPAAVAMSQRSTTTGSTAWILLTWLLHGWEARCGRMPTGRCHRRVAVLTILRRGSVLLFGRRSGIGPFLMRS